MVDRTERQEHTTWIPPVVDMEAPSAAEVIAKACKERGFFYLENHGVHEEIILKVLDQTKAFFDLDIEVKMSFLSDRNSRGYIPVGLQVVDQENQSTGDTKEAFDIWRDIDPESEEAGKPLRTPNKWPTESLLPGWKATMSDYFNTMDALAGRVAGLLAISIGVDPGRFEDCFSESLNGLRLIRYSPQVSYPEQGIFAAGEHSDFGAMTLLATDEVPGLQVFVDDKWFDVPPRPGAFICNIGDILQRWTNGHLQSTVHRVVNKQGCERYSIPFFVAPNFDAEVGCLTQFCLEDDPAKYSPTTCGIYLLEKLSEKHSELNGKMEPSKGKH